MILIEIFQEIQIKLLEHYIMEEETISIKLQISINKDKRQVLNKDDISTKRMTLTLLLIMMILILKLKRILHLEKDSFNITQNNKILKRDPQSQP